MLRLVVIIVTSLLFVLIDATVANWLVGYIFPSLHWGEFFWIMIVATLPVSSALFIHDISNDLS